jgi:hypothetical protein
VWKKWFILIFNIFNILYGKMKNSCDLSVGPSDLYRVANNILGLLALLTAFISVSLYCIARLFTWRDFPTQHQVSLVPPLSICVKTVDVSTYDDAVMDLTNVATILTKKCVVGGASQHRKLYVKRARKEQKIYAWLFFTLFNITYSSHIYA